MTRSAGVGRGSPPTRWRERGWGRQGYTFIEVALALLFLSVVMASAYTALLQQRRFYTAHVQMARARNAATTAVEVLTGELRAASPAGGDLYAIAKDSVALRSSTGFGVVCTIAGHVLGLRVLTGTFGEAETDSLLVFVERSFETAEDDGWTGRRIREVRAGGAGRCPDGHPPEIELVMGTSIAGATVGSPVRAFRPYVYKLYRGRNGNWWFGQRLRNGQLQPVAGPFADPASGGLRFEYLTDAAIPAGAPSQVVQVRITVRAQSHRPIPRPGGPAFFRDSLSTVVYLRNS